MKSSFAWIVLLLLAFSWAGAASPSSAGTPIGVPVTYQLPADGSLPRTYLVTLAIVDPKNTDWILSTFVAGAPRTVTAENSGRFTETWDGLDENFMPLPPGQYAVKGIYMPAKKWEIDDEWHAIIPKYAGAISGWWPRVDAPAEKLKVPFGGDPVSAPFGDVSVASNGIAAFYYQYLENGLNCPMVDLTKPGVSPDQFIKSFTSGGAAGGSSVATDGETVWAFSTDGGPKFVYRADGKSFGNSPGCNRVNSYPPEGWVTSMTAWKDEAAQRTLVYIAQRGKIIPQKLKNWTRHIESESDFANLITVHEGADGKVLATIPVSKPQGLFVQKGRLYVLHTDEKGFLVSSMALQNGLPSGPLQTTFKVSADITPFDFKADSKGRFYLSDAKANKVYQLDSNGKILRTFGKMAAQKPGAYDPMTLMAPGKLATWKDAEGKDRLIIVEKAGPNRVAEWNPDTGELIRDFQTYQTFTNNSGYAVDPEHPEDLYIQGQEGWFVRFKMDYEKHTCAVNAVWPLETDPHLGINPDRLDTFPGKFLLSRANGQLYIVSATRFVVFHVTPERCALSAALIKAGEGKDAKYAFWHDANGNGIVDEAELTPTPLPVNFVTAHGQNWLENLSFLAINMGGRDAWRVSPEGFDAHGNPVFKEWTKVLTDPVFEARSKGVVDALHGGNEVGDRFTSDWTQADGSSEGIYIQARSGYSFNANEGAQHKISFYAPDKDGNLRQKWRVGRTALQWTARSGEMYGGMRIHRPINGLLSVTDQSRCGILLYTQDGLYVDTLFPDGRRVSAARGGLFLLPGEYFTGSVFPNKNNGKIYLGLGKYTPTFFETEGWSLTENPVKPLTALQQTVSLSSSQIAAPPEIALTIRGGAGTAKIARFAPALGGAVLDGSLTGWESCDPVQYQSDKDQTVEVRCLYDADHLYLRWHARFSDVFEPKPLPPLQRMFTHDQLSHTLDFYFQGNPEAKPGSSNGRPGDTRFVFGVFKNGTKVEPVGVGMYPSWEGRLPASPQTYRTPVGEVSFAHVGAIADARYGYSIDADNKGLVLVAAIPRAALPSLKTPFGRDLHTLINFSANFGGHNKFWWANSDATASKETYDEPSEARLYPGSWAPVQFTGIEDGITVKKWLICGPFGGPGAEKLTKDPNGKMPGTNKDWKVATQEFCEAQKYPPDDKVDTAAVYQGDIIQGYWNHLGSVTWKPATIADLDTRVKLGTGGQVWYGVTWIYAPAATEVEFDFQGHLMTPLRWFVNGEPINVGKYTDFKTSNNIRYQVAAKTLSLRQGWNQVMFRGYCFGFAPFNAGLVLKGSPDKLWPLRFSTTPPKH